MCTEDHLKYIGDIAEAVLHEREVAVVVDAGNEALVLEVALLHLLDLHLQVNMEAHLRRQRVEVERQERVQLLLADALNGLALCHDV